MPRSGIELTTSRLHSFIMAEVSHALNHSAMEAVKNKHSAVLQNIIAILDDVNKLSM